MNWPRKDGKIFIKTKNEDNSVTLFSSGNIIDDFLKYSNGYKESADLLIKYLIKTEEISKLDTYFFPITYLYRQSIELIMKAIFFDQNHDEVMRESFLYNTKHDLLLIWEKIVPYLKNEIRVNKDLLDWINKSLTDISKFDKHSDVFRYPNTKELELFFKEEKRYDLRTLAENMHSIYMFFKNFFEDDPCSDLDEIISRKPKVFVEGGSYYEFAHVGWSSDIEYHFHKYIKGYKECADILVENVLYIEKKKVSYDMTFPICFLYRNLLELIIKDILINYSSLNITKIKKTLNNKKHKLIGLWNRIKKDISEVPHDEEDKTLEYVENYLEEFHQMDVRSDKFRYPINFNMENHFKSSKNIDIKNLTICLDELCNFFNGVTEMLMRKKELKQEIMREYKSYIDY
jgi:hypothetical protein